MRETEATGSSSETYMSSREWLESYGLKAKRLGFYDILAGVAFKHTDGVVDMRYAPTHLNDQMQTDSVRLQSMTIIHSQLN